MTCARKHGKGRTRTSVCVVDRSGSVRWSDSDLGSTENIKGDQLGFILQCVVGRRRDALPGNRDRSEDESRPTVALSERLPP